MALISGQDPLLLRGSVNKIKQKTPKLKQPIPEPENSSMEYLQCQNRCARKYLTAPIVSMSEAIRNKWYPSSAESTENKLPGEGRLKSIKFAKGLEHLGLGSLSPGKKHFKRKHFDDDDCDNPEDLKRKYKLLNCD